MEHTRKIPSKDTSLSSSNKLKPSDSSLPASSASSGGSGPDDDHLCKTEQEIVSGSDDETKFDPSWGNGNGVSTESSTFVGSEALEDDPKADDNLEENGMEWKRKPSHNALRITFKKKKGTRRKKPKKSQSTRQTEDQPSKAYTCACGRSYTNNSHLRRHQKTMVCIGSSAEEPRRVTAARGRRRTKLDPGWGNENCVSTESFTFVGSDSLEDDQSAVGWDNGNCVSTESSTFVGSESLEEDESAVKADDENLMEWSHKPRHTGLRKTFKEDKGTPLKKTKKSPSTKRTQNQPFGSYTCACGRSYTNNSHLRRHQKTMVCIGSIHSRAEEPRKGKAARGRRRAKLDSSWGNGNGVGETESFTLVDSEAVEDDQKADDNIEDNPVEWDRKPSHTVLRKTIKEEKGTQEKRPRKSQSTQETENEPTKLYTCACGKSYTNNSHLRRHQKTQVCGCPRVEPRRVKTTKGKPGGSFPCNCGKSYFTASHFYRHQKTCQASPLTSLEAEAEESRLKPHVCACGKRYTNSSHLYRHQRSHVDGEEESDQTFICDCGRVFSSRSHLSQHMKTHTIETFQIQDLGDDPVKETTTEAPRKKKSYACPCGKRYTSTSHLYRHQRTHQEGIIVTSARHRADRKETERPYKCECGKSYASKPHLYRHRRSHKTQELVVDETQELVVDETEERVIDDLNCDSDVHAEDSGEKLFLCECGKSFILWFSLELHKRVHCKAKLQSSSAPEQDSSGVGTHQPPDDTY